MSGFCLSPLKVTLALEAFLQGLLQCAEQTLQEPWLLEQLGRYHYSNPALITSVFNT